MEIMSSITASIGKDHYTTTITTGGKYHLQADEPIEKGGNSDGATPEELLGATLGACTCITLRMYADRKQWPLERIETSVNVYYKMDDTVPTIGLTIQLHGALDEEQKQRLLVIARKCPMHKAISSPVAIETQML